MHQFTPEMLYADTTDRKRAYGELSKGYATTADAFAAVSAAWLADINTLQAVMWERVMIAMPDPEHAFETIGAAVTRAMADYARTAGPAASARDAAERARSGLASAFDLAARRAVEAEYLPLDHLDGLHPPTAEESQRVLSDRLGGEALEVVSQRHRQTARESMRTALEMRDRGVLDEALSLAWQADWATLEAYLLDSAHRVGDDTLISVDFRWTIVAEAVADIESLPMDFLDAVATIRDKMADALGLVEGARLVDQFEPVC